MNSKNTDLFFNDSEDETTLVTVSPEDGDPFDVEVVAAMEIEELSQEYVAVLPAEPSDDFPEDELILFRYTEDEDGNPEFEGIDDDEELEDVAAAFEQYFNQLDEDEDEDEDDNYLGDIGSYVPGVSIENE